MTRPRIHRGPAADLARRPFARVASALSAPALTAVTLGATLALALSIITCAGTLARADGARAGRGAAERVVPQAEIAGRLASRGYAVTEPVVRRGSAYLTHGRDRFGQRTRLVVDARNAEIIGLRVVEPAAGAARPLPRIGRP
ncbi:hypothetical protein [Phreatobacter sp.]|uniref:hypothetical protein n=1 Tax=Phreatobacter sp. TaxID=1966341 RepID=UPI003F7117AF